MRTPATWFSLECMLKRIHHSNDLCALNVSACFYSWRGISNVYSYWLGKTINFVVSGMEEGKDEFLRWFLSEESLSFGSLTSSHAYPNSSCNNILSGSYRLAAFVSNRKLWRCKWTGFFNNFQTTFRPCQRLKHWANHLAMQNSIEGEVIMLE